MDISVVMEQLSHATQGRFDRRWLERAAATETALIAAANSLLIRWFSSCSSTRSCGDGS
jgi:hypothetical protein